MTKRFIKHHVKDLRPPPPGAPASPRVPEEAMTGKGGAIRASDKRPGTPREIGGPEGPEPTRFGDWERKGICVDF